MADKSTLASPLLMPKATAMWLIEKTPLTFKQIGDFTGLHEIEVQALADGEVGRGIVGRDPVLHNEVTAAELEKAMKDNNYRMRYAKSELPALKIRAKGPRYTPVSKRSDKPDAIAYIIKHNPEITDAQICKLVGTTKPTVMAVRDRTHPNAPNIKPRHPADLGLCSYQEYELASEKGFRAQGKDPEAEKAARLAREQDNMPVHEEPQQQSGGFSGFDFSNFLNRSSKSE